VLVLAAEKGHKELHVRVPYEKPSKVSNIRIDNAITAAPEFRVHPTVRTNFDGNWQTPLLGDRDKDLLQQLRALRVARQLRRGTASLMRGEAERAGLRHVDDRSGASGGRAGAVREAREGIVGDMEVVRCAGHEVIRMHRVHPISQELSRPLGRRGITRNVQGAEERGPVALEERVCAKEEAQQGVLYWNDKADSQE
jgi:hypothetical protein